MILYSDAELGELNRHGLIDYIKRLEKVIHLLQDQVNEGKNNDDEKKNQAAEEPCDHQARQGG